jgi:hypothetical protein
MCNPLAFAAVLMAGGTALQYKANQDRKQEMKSLQRRETERQDKYYAEAQGNLAKNRDSYTRENVEQKMADAATERQAQYQKADAAAPRANEIAPGAQGTNTVVNDAFSRALAGAQGEASQQGGLRAALASFGDALGENAIDNNRRTGEIGMVGSFSRGSANVLPLELQHAMTRERSAATIGGIMQAFGGAMLGGGAGLGAAGAGAGAGSLGAGAAGMGAGAAGTAAGGLSNINWSRLFG